MSFLDRLFGAGSTLPPEREAPRLALPATVKNASPENPTTSLANPDAWLFDALGSGAGGYSPVSVSEANSVRSSTVFACVSLLSGIVASLPLKVYQRTPKGRMEANGHRLYPLLHDAPAPAMTSFIWRESMTISLLLWGNAYSVIRYDNAARVVGFEYVEPQRVQPARTKSGLGYLVHWSDGSIETVHNEDMLHVAGPGFDGLRGLSRIQAVARQSIGTDLALAESTARLHGNRTLPSGVVEVGPKISSDAFKRMRQEFNNVYSGLSNHGKVVFADSGSKFTALSLTPEDAQTIESRRFQVTDIARIFGVPPHLIGETSASTSWGSGIEQMTLSFMAFSLNKDLSRIEAELNGKLFAGTDFYAEFSRDALLQMDAKSRGELYASAIQNGWMTPNEVRALQNMPPLTGGDQAWIQSNLQPLNKPTLPPGQ